MSQQQTFGPYQSFDPGAISNEQRERAVAHLQALYANGTLGEAELDRRLTLAFGAENRAQLSEALQNLPRIAPVALRRPAPGEPTPAENVAAGLTHLSGFMTSFIGPAIVRAVATPGSRVWWEASRAFSLQLTALAAGAAIAVVTAVLGIGGGLAGAAWLAWVVGTIWASVRAFNGKSSTGGFEHLLLARPVAPRTALGQTR